MKVVLLLVVLVVPAETPVVKCKINQLSLNSPPSNPPTSP